MPEKLVPCFLDPRKDCNSTCPLRDFSKDAIDGHFSLAKPSNPALGLREGLNNSSPKEVAKFITSQIENLRDLIPVEQCEFYPSSN